MTDRDLVEEFSQADGVPDLALALALLQPDRIADATLRVIEAAAWGEALSRRDENLLFWGIHVLGAARQERAFRPLMRLLRLSSDRLDELLGDAMTETLPRIVAGAFDGDAQELMAVIADPSLDDSLRWQLFGALAFLTQVGRINRTETIRFLHRFDDERLAVEGDIAWEGWAEAIALLGLREMAERLDAALRDGRVTEEISGREWFEEMLRRAEAGPEDLTRFTDERLGYIEDLLAELDWVPHPDDVDEDLGLESASLDVDVPEPAINPVRHVGRNDPCPCGSGKKFKKCCLIASAE
jgi:uncharacterized protein